MPASKVLPALVTAIALAAPTLPLQAAEGLLVVQSPYDATATMDRLEAEVARRGLTVFARIDHAAGAVDVDLELRPTQLLIFGNPKGGTPFMQCAQSVGIDLPLKALVWEDAAGDVHLGWNDPAYIAARHGVPDCPPVGRIQGALRGIAEAVVARQ
jgi:uncharacterized protein (DUF302 family)